MTKKSAVKSRPRAPVDGYEDNGEPVSDIDEASEIIPFRYTITSYGADYPVDGRACYIANTGAYLTEESE